MGAVAVARSTFSSPADYPQAPAMVRNNRGGHKVPIFPLDTAADLRDKIDWEGGICGALDWGLTSDDIPAEFRTEWTAIAALYEKLDALCADLYARLPSPDCEAEA